MQIPTYVLRTAREAAGVKQTELAGKLGVSGSVISRLEKTELTDGAMARRYLEAVDTSTASAFLEFYERDWRLSERPSFFHPDRQILWTGELALQRLEAFTHSQDYDSLLDVPLAQIRTSLELAVSFIAKLDHRMAYIGPVGIGKTTALCLLAGLLTEGKSGQPEPVFPATGGRTTICEVVVRAAPAYALGVEPMGEDALRLLVTDIVKSLSLNVGGVATELERAVRNMAGLLRTRDDSRTLVDPMKSVVSGKDVEEAVDDIMTRMQLAARTETHLIISKDDDDGLRWLSEHVTKINFGQHPKFSLPERITAFIPGSLQRSTPYDLSIVDTKGVQGTMLREDLLAHLDDARTLSVLCCGFNDAPGTDVLKMLHQLELIGSDALEKQRIVILALPRGDEAMKIVDETGEPPDRHEDGYEIRAQQVTSTLITDSLPDVPVVFFNPMTDTPAAVWDQLSGCLEVLRRQQLVRLVQLVDVSEDLVTNADAAKIQQARVAIGEEITRIVQGYGTPGSLIRPAHQNLIEELESGHASSIAASVNRRGAWSNFNVHYMIGVGVRVDANLRTHSLFAKIDGRLEGLEQKFTGLLEVVTILASLREALSSWRQEYLLQASKIGRAAFKPHLDAASDMWDGLSEHWGQGSGYRRKVADDVKQWFEQAPDLADARRRVENRLGKAWHELVLGRLSAAGGLSKETMK